MLVSTQSERKLYIKIYIFVSYEIQLFHFPPSVLKTVIPDCLYNVFELAYVKMDRYANLETFVLTGESHWNSWCECPLLNSMAGSGSHDSSATLLRNIFPYFTAKSQPAQVNRIVFLKINTDHSQWRVLSQLMN